ncbi:FAD-dependent oxidoreductase [Pseudomonas sp. PDM31]|uniref:FAD-dependent oxidoreductase n=1 Tax=Pseudomonas sp. PDM31 TaxID=2854778 RepID=UPI001C45DF2A|nr:FAD-dependent oxidoreductase [Pseudomonas sp. PDM31]MBV7477634.1 FAD-dependent oxidoreductase [Pseudomonas sp. PDM31]
MSDIKLPLRVAIVGAGPSGLYAVQHLLERHDLDVRIDIYERLPTPWGLVRAAVAPDHPEKKLVIDRLFSALLKHPCVRFFGNVAIGREVTSAELHTWYHAVIYAVGADDDTRMNISGENLPGSHSAREFVAWYNGHPDYSHLTFDFSHTTAVIVGNGNVALDVARILTLPIEALEKTDIANHALRALETSAIQEVVILGRRDAVYGAFNNPELEELAHLPGVAVKIEGAHLPSDDEMCSVGVDWESRRKVRTLRQLRTKEAANAGKSIVLRFLASPLEVLGADKAEHLRIALNHMEDAGNGGQVARANGTEAMIPAGLILRSIGYRGRPFPGLPYDDRNGVIRNVDGRVCNAEDFAVLGAYVTGWIKRGPRGIIGSNKKCARDTVRALIEDFTSGRLNAGVLDEGAIAAVLAKRQPQLVTLLEWLAIDLSEREAGRVSRRPRVKKTTFEALLAR